MEVLPERHKTERKIKGKKDKGEGEESIPDLEQHKRGVREARSLPAFEIHWLVWQSEGRLSPQNTFLLKMPSRFEKCPQLLLESMTSNSWVCIIFFPY